MMTVYRNSNECINIYRMLISMIHICGRTIVHGRVTMLQMRTVERCADYWGRTCDRQLGRQLQVFGKR